MSTFLSVDVFWVKLTQKFFNFHVKTVIRNDFFSSGKCSWQNFWQIHIRIIFYSSKFLRNDMRYTFWVKLTQFGSMKVKTIMFSILFQGAETRWFKISLLINEADVVFDTKKCINCFLRFEMGKCGHLRNVSINHIKPIMISSGILAKI